MITTDVSETSVCNMALAHLGVSKKISTLKNDKSQEADICRQFFTQVRDQVLSDYWWNFGTSFAKLALVQQNPTCEWGYAYRIPSNSLRIRRVLSGLRTDNRQSRVPFKEAADSAGGLLYTDKECAEVEYMMDQIDPTKWTPDFIMAFSLRLSVVISPSLTGGDPFNMLQKNQARYEMEIGKAQANQGNEEQPDIEPESEYIRARGGTGCYPFDGRKHWLP